MKGSFQAPMISATPSGSRCTRMRPGSNTSGIGSRCGFIQSSTFFSAYSASLAQ